ncbi:hypothetical protein Nepgr_017289 [Nepenthes gracilis]|uniref:Uncharacterized protein n=1 Tax=Nepenthes gracilis TaxID=150966 RepID=A0AAD3XSC5_NEPGR|nr:hypothetical protein Nepgr_017289 [Nepenthes gracilis]
MGLLNLFDPSSTTSKQPEDSPHPLPGRLRGEKIDSLELPFTVDEGRRLRRWSSTAWAMLETSAFLEMRPSIAEKRLPKLELEISSPPQLKELEIFTSSPREDENFGRGNGGVVKNKSGGKEKGGPEGREGREGNGLTDHEAGGEGGDGDERLQTFVIGIEVFNPSYFK